MIGCCTGPRQMARRWTSLRADVSKLIKVSRAQMLQTVVDQPVKCNNAKCQVDKVKEELPVVVNADTVVDPGAVTKHRLAMRQESA